MVVVVFLLVGDFGRGSCLGAQVGLGGDFVSLVQQFLVDAVVEVVAAAVPVVLVASEVGDGFPGLEDVGVGDSEGHLHDALEGARSEVEDDAVEERDSDVLDLDDDVEEVGLEVGGVESGEEPAAGGRHGGGEALGDVEPVVVGLFGGDAPLAVHPVEGQLPAVLAGDDQHCEGAGGEGDEVDDGGEGFVLGLEVVDDGGLDVLGEGVDVGLVAEGLGLEFVGLVVGEDVVGFHVLDVGGLELVVVVEVADFEDGAVGGLGPLHEHHLADGVLAADVVLESAPEGGGLVQQFPVDLVEHHHAVAGDFQHLVAVPEVGGVVELDHVEAALELDVDQLVAVPEFGVDGLVELDDGLVVGGLGDVGGGHEERDPVVAAEAAEVGRVEVVAVDEVAAALVDEDDDVDLVAGVHEVLQSRVDQPHVASALVEDGVGRGDLVEAQPVELGDHVLVGLVEREVGVEALDLAPVFVGLAVGVEGALVDLQQGGFLGVAVEVGLVVLLDEEGFEVDGEFHVLVALGVAGDGDVQQPLLVEVAEGLVELFHGLVVEGGLAEFLDAAGVEEGL